MALDPLNYGRVLDQILNLSGIEINTLTTIQWRLMRDFVSRRIKFGWQQAKWPEVCIQESRTPTQSGGDEGNYIDLNQAGETDIGEVFNVWNKSPKANQDQVEMTWYLSENGIQISESTTPVWVYYRKTPIELTGEQYSQSTSYVSGDQAYDTTLKDFYVANQAVASGADNSPNTQPSYWDKVSIPKIFEDYLIRGAVSDYLRHNGEYDRARIAEKDASDVIEHEILKLQKTQGQTTRIEVKTY